MYLDGPFSYQRWFKNLRAGRSIATNGPLLQVFVNGRPPGAELAWHKGMHAHITVEVHSQAPLDRVEIVFNGQVIHTLPASGRPAFKATLDLPIAQPGWLAVRCFEPVTDTIRYVHSSPFYFPEGGRLPVDKSEAERWANYVRTLAASADPASFPVPGDYQKTEETLKEAENIYRRLAEGYSSVIPVKQR